MALKRKADFDLPENPASTVKPRLETPCDLAYPILSRPPRSSPAFQRPSQLLTFSYTPSRTLEFTDSALRYFASPPRNADLGYAYDRWIRRPEERGRLDGLLHAWTRVKRDMKREHEAAASKTSWKAPDVGVVSWRGVMTKILTAPYEERDGWELNVMTLGGTMYFEEHLSEDRLREKNDMEPRHRLQSYYGYAFESYCTSSDPNQRQDSESDATGWSGDVDTNVQWCSVAKTKLGDTRLIIGGEVDCVRGKYSGGTDNFVELKTSLAIRGAHDEAKFEKKLLKFYFQSFLLGVPEIFVGFRKPSGHLTTTQSFQTIQIPRLVRGKPGAWDPLICLDWGSKFLSFLQDTVKSGSQRDVWRLKFVPKVGVTAVVLDEIGVRDVEAGEDRVGFLPRWYWDDHVGTGEEVGKGINEKAAGANKFAIAAGWQL
ncbi:RAI1 like PD-XK nuclease-domain-containing protein [Hygrophoropsis aurantiaca]|uniref:RAI1 like PD-XK nuclease-domain-containing protein n=1 Tax=Hygrophoropsis aurantiaca TaxID=72124 RepID=A0ACB8ARF6_9AGAM|nr:RAI1 like PD-XK nuclease-domain-containing protein [Hygrophoropsis aurantiaca]